MRLSSWCHTVTSCAPKKLVAKTPVTNTTRTVRMAPSPGMCMPSQLSVRHSSGSSSSDWSSESKMAFSTQIVMISGIQMSSPVIRYFFTAPGTKKPGARRAGQGNGPRSAGRGGHLVLRCGLGVRFRLAFRFGFRLALRFGFRRALGRGGLLGRLLAALEIGGIPAAAIQLEARGAQLLAELRAAAGRALRDRPLRDFLEEILLVPALSAAVLVNRHAADYIPDFRTEYRLPCRRICRPASSAPPSPQRPPWARAPSARQGPHAERDAEPHRDQRGTHCKYAAGAMMPCHPAPEQSAEEHPKRLRGVVDADCHAAARRRRQARDQRRQQRFEHVEGNEK